jgi:hypothetical protein
VVGEIDVPGAGQYFVGRGVVAAAAAITVEIVERNPNNTGFVPQPIRWRGEQTLGILIPHRRLVRDYESRPASSEPRVYWAEADRMSRRLTGTTAVTWRAMPAAV